MKKKGLIVITIFVLVAIGFLGYFTSTTIGYAESQFEKDGFILSTIDYGNAEDTANAQYYFNAGEKFLNKQDNTITFKTVNGEKVNVSKENFIHYQDSSMCAMQKSVLLDTDSLQNEAVQYYTISSDSIIEKRTNGYAFFNGAEIMNVSNFLWKISETQYMIVSDTITLVVDEDSTQTFNGFIQLLYKDFGVVYLVNQDGTYSTVSSTAYLELANGKRVYIGSKNVSDGEGILMNLSDMLVSPDLEPSLSPDEEFRNEVDEQSQIQIDSSDGVSGDSGTDGGQGNAGNPGSPGSGGDPGTDADSSNVRYEEEGMPVFRASLNPLSYGVDAHITYQNTNCQINESKTYISIVETASGNEVWRQYPYNEGSNPSGFHMINTGFDVSCYTLKQSKNYTFNIMCTFTPDATGEEKTQIVYSKFFTTLSIGIELDVKEVGENSIICDILKTSDNPVINVVAQIYDVDGNQIGESGTYALPTDESIFTDPDKFNPIMSQLNVSTMQNGDAIEVKFGDLNRNTVYYVRLEAVSVDTSKGASTNIITTESFPLILVKTLKKSPTLGTPYVSVSERDNSFIITPTDINDPDHGILSYVYEIYEVGDVATANENRLTFNNPPKYSIEKNTAADLSVPIDGTTIKRETDYVCRVLAKFDNNDTVVSYSSPLSATFCAGSSSWPIILNNLTEKYTNASSIQGTLIISDPSKTIDASLGITIGFKSATPVNGIDLTRTIQVSQTVIDKGSSTGYYEIPYFLYGLKDDQQYSIYAYAGQMTSNGQTYTDCLIGTSTFKTPKYTPLTMEVKNLRDDGGDERTAFSYQITLNSSYPLQEENLTQVIANSLAKEHKLDNMGDFSGKALQCIRLDILASDSLNKNKPGEIIPGSNPVLIYDESLTNPLDFTFGDSDASLYKKYYLTDVNNGIRVTENDFGLTNQQIKGYIGSNIFIKVTAYDYCYGVGISTSQLFGNNNVIPIGTYEEEFHMTLQENILIDEPDDCYIVVSAQSGLPALPTDKLIVNEVTKAQALVNTYSLTDKISNNETATTDTKINFSSDPWSDIYTTTAVGMEIKGHQSFFEYAKAVKYTIYKSKPSFVGDEVTGDFVETSGWLDINYMTGGVNSCTPYTFFYDVASTDLRGEGRTISRGDRFYVVTEFKLRNAIGGKEIYPTEFIPSSFDTSQILVDLDGYVSNKQVPQIFIAEKNGISVDSKINPAMVTANTVATYYFDYNDPDKALLYTGGFEYNNIDMFIATDIYDPSYNTKATGIVLSENAEHNALNPYQTRYLIKNLELNRPSSGNPLSLFFKYKLTNDSDAQVQFIKSASNENIIAKMCGNIRIADTTNTTETEREQIINVFGMTSFESIFMERDEGTLNFIMVVLTENKDSIVGLDMKFTKKELDDNGTPDDPSDDTFLVKMNDNETPLDSSDDYPEKLVFSNVQHVIASSPIVTFRPDGEDPYYAYKITVPIPTSQILEFLGRDYFDVEASVKYDTGRFGTDYANSGCVSNGLGYTLQKSDSRKFVTATGSLSPNLFTIPSDVPSDSDTRLTKFEDLVNSQGVATKYAKIPAYESGNLMVTSSGLELIPREVSETTGINPNLQLTGVIADIYATVIPSVEVARVIIDVGENNNLDLSTDNIIVRLQKVNDSREPIGPVIQKSLSFSRTQHTQQSIEFIDLDRDTNYEISIYAVVDGIEEKLGRRLKPGTTSQYEDTITIDGVTKIGSGTDRSFYFKTIKEVIPRVDKLTFAAKNTDRNDKTVTVSFTVLNAKKMDIESVDHLSISLQNSSGENICSTPLIVTGAELLEAFETQNFGIAAETQANTALSYELDGSQGWMPDEKHILGLISGENYHTYKVSIAVTYKNTGSSLNEDYAIKSFKSSDWMNKGSLQTIKATAKRTADTAINSKVSLTGTVAMKDPIRVFNPQLGINPDDPGNYYVPATLKLRLSNDAPVTGISDEQVVYLKYNMDNGTISPIDFEFTDVTTGPSYKIYATIDADFNNDGIFESYTVNSGKISTPTSDPHIELVYVSIDPEAGSRGESQIYLYGRDLDTVKQINYRIYQIAPIQNSSEGQIKGDALIPVYKPINAYSNNGFMLKIPEDISDTNAEYTIEVELFSEVNKSTPDSQLTGTYEPSLGGLLGF